MMQFSIDTGSLLQASQIMSRAVSSKTTIPALTGIYFECINENTLLLKATDLEIGIEHTVSAKVEETGSMVVPAKYLLDILRKLPNTNITLTKKLDENTLQINYRESHVNLNTFPVDQFSFLPGINQDRSLTIKSDILATMIKKISISFSHDISRPVLNGALFELTDNMLRFVSSDTYRLSLIETVLDKVSEEEFMPIIIPSKALIELTRLIDKDETIKIIIDNKQAQFETNNLKIGVRLIEGKFPSYKNVIPTEYSTRIIADTKDLLLSIERATVISSDESFNKTCTIKLEFMDNTIYINSYSPSIGQLHDKLLINKEGEDISISFNGNYLVDILKIIDTEKVIIELNGNLSPGIIKPFGSTINYLSLILPVRG
ncbi:MAG: DNA polymerase III subunit beta [Clostridia bacterium]|jgi:DNA polymerase-3 subunit beta|nr:DNA polymerase III subunit beta [Clostridia bacterium]